MEILYNVVDYNTFKEHNITQAGSKLSNIVGKNHTYLYTSSLLALSAEFSRLCSSVPPSC